MAPPEPTRDLDRALRLAVFDHAATESRRVFPARLHVGEPGGATMVRAISGTDEDHGLRADLVAAMVVRCGVQRPLVWLTRTGDLHEAQDIDQVWLAAAVAAFAEAELPLVFVLVNRHGWWDPRTGAERTWVRARERQR